MLRTARLGALAAMASLAALGIPAHAQPLTSTCAFTAGSRAHQWQDFAGLTGAHPAIVGSYCQDGLGSSGVAIPSPGQAIVPAPMTFTCAFTAGGRGGTWFDFASIPGAVPTTVGSPCQDVGTASIGFAIPSLPN